jgi:hypothetical protein
MAATERTLTQVELNRALLARQHLIDPSGVPLPRVLEKIGGIQAQYAPSSYIGLWSRVRGFKREDLTRALERRTVVQGTLMRITIHLVSPRDYQFFSAGLREARRRFWRRFRPQIDSSDVAAAAKRLRTLLADGPRRRDDLVKALGINSEMWNGIGLWIDLVRVPPSGTWERRRADLYAIADEWIGTQEASEDEGLEHLIRRYLQGFGPAPIADIASWAGVPIRLLRPIVEGLELRKFRDEAGRELLDLPRAPLPAGDAPVPVRFLPTWDATLLAHARRTGILPEPYRPRVFETRTPHSVNTFLVDGRVAGTWSHEAGRVKLEPFDRISRSAQREISPESERLSELLS